MLEELERRNYSPSTTRAYLRAVEEFARYFNRPPDQLGPDHIRQYQAYLFRERKLDPNTVIQHLGGLRVRSGRRISPQTLMATSRLRRGSRARYTTPMRWQIEERAGLYWTLFTRYPSSADDVVYTERRRYPIHLPKDTPS